MCVGLHFVGITLLKGVWGKGEWRRATLREGTHRNRETLSRDGENPMHRNEKTGRVAWERILRDRVYTRDRKSVA